MVTANTRSNAAICRILRACPKGVRILSSLRYAGRHEGTGRGYSYNKILDVDIAVTVTDPTQAVRQDFTLRPGG